MSFTLTTLKQAIKDYCENEETSFVTNLDRIIKVAEERIFRRADLDDFRTNVVSSVSTGCKYISKPIGFLSTFSLRVYDADSSNVLLIKDVSFMEELGTSVGLPKYYAMFDTGNIVINPTPDRDYSVELHYYHRPPSLTTLDEPDSDEMTWVSEHAPNALLYGCLVEAYTYMKGEKDLMEIYQTRFRVEVNLLKDLAEGRENSDSYRSGLPSKPRT